MDWKAKLKSITGGRINAIDKNVGRFQSDHTEDFNSRTGATAHIARYPENEKRTRSISPEMEKDMITKRQKLENQLVMIGIWKPSLALDDYQKRAVFARIVGSRSKIHYKLSMLTPSGQLAKIHTGLREPDCITFSTIKLQKAFVGMSEKQLTDAVQKQLNDPEAEKEREITWNLHFGDRNGGGKVHVASGQAIMGTANMSDETPVILSNTALEKPKSQSISRSIPANLSVHGLFGRSNKRLQTQRTEGAADDQEWPMDIENNEHQRATTPFEWNAKAQDSSQVRITTNEYVNSRKMSSSGQARPSVLPTQTQDYHPSQQNMTEVKIRPGSQKPALMQQYFGRTYRKDAENTLQKKLFQVQKTSTAVPQLLETGREAQADAITNTETSNIKSSHSQDHLTIRNLATLKEPSNFATVSGKAKKMENYSGLSNSMSDIGNLPSFNKKSLDIQVPGQVVLDNGDVYKVRNARPFKGHLASKNTQVVTFQAEDRVKYQLLAEVSSEDVEFIGSKWYRRSNGGTVMTVDTRDLHKVGGKTYEVVVHYVRLD